MVDGPLRKWLKESEGSNQLKSEVSRLTQPISEIDPSDRFKDLRLTSKGTSVLTTFDKVFAGANGGVVISNRGDWNGTFEGDHFYTQGARFTGDWVKGIKNNLLSKAKSRLGCRKGRPSRR